MGDEWACPSCGFQYNASNSGVCVACDRRRAAPAAPPVAATAAGGATRGGAGGGGGGGGAEGGALAAERQAAVERALALVGRDPASAEDTVRKLSSVLLDIVREPDNARYRRLRLSNPRVAALVDGPGVADILQAAGFQRTQHAPQAQPGVYTAREPVPYLELLPVQDGDAQRCAGVARLLEDWLALRRQMQASLAAAGGGSSSSSSFNRTCPPPVAPRESSPQVPPPAIAPSAQLDAAAAAAASGGGGGGNAPPDEREVQLRKTATGVGLNISETGVVKAVKSPEAASAGAEVGAQIVAVNGVFVDGRASIVDVMRSISMDRYHKRHF